MKAESLADFSACSASGGSTFSGLVQLNHTYENNRFDVDHCSGDGRVPEFVQKQLGPEEGGAHGRLDCVDNSRNDDEEEFDNEEVLDERFS
jgi:hypothetical protein